MREYPTDAQVRRAVLGHLVCGKTVAAWESLPLDSADKPLYYHFRSLCRSVLLGELEVDAARKQLRSLDNQAQRVDFRDDFNGLYAFHAVRAACYDAIWPRPFLTSTNLNMTEGEIDPDDFRPPLFCSCVSLQAASV